MHKIIQNFVFYFRCKFPTEYIPTVAKYNGVSAQLQFLWIQKYYPDFGVRCFDEGYLGCSYPTDSIEIAEYETHPEDYGTLELIETVGFELSDDRISEILSGDKLNQEEIMYLREAIADADTDGWWGHHGFDIKLSDGKCFAYFLGMPGGQGGPEFEYVSNFDSRRAMLIHIRENFSNFVEM